MAEDLIACRFEAGLLREFAARLASDHDDLDGQLLSLVPAKPQQLEHANEGLVGEGKRHNLSWLTASSWRRSR